MRDILLGVDIGTSACKAAAFDGEGRVFYQAVRGHVICFAVQAIGVLPGLAGKWEENRDSSRQHGDHLQIAAVQMQQFLAAQSHLCDHASVIGDNLHIQGLCLILQMNSVCHRKPPLFSRPAVQRHRRPIFKGY